jgi:CheY-like chemotaxis protein
MSPIDVLLVEDNPADARLTREALSECKLTLNVHAVRDGEEAMAFLRREGPFHNVRLPDLILLDLHLPKKNGREVLADIKNDPELKTIPVVVLTSSKSEEDILRSYQLHANCFVSKPLGLEEFQRVVAEIESFWFTIVKLPQEK